MDCIPKTIYYCSISSGAKILTEFSCGNPEADSWAALCLQNIPPFHAWYFQRFRNRFFAFLMEDNHVFFVIADEVLGKKGVFNFLGCVRENFRAIIQSGAKGSLTALCLRDALHPVLLRLIQSLESISRVDPDDQIHHSLDENDQTGVAINSYSDQKSFDTETSKQKLAQSTWRRRVWVILGIDLILCLVLFGIWLAVCDSFTCLSS